MTCGCDGGFTKGAVRGSGVGDPLPMLGVVQVRYGVVAQEHVPLWCESELGEGGVADAQVQVNRCEMGCTKNAAYGCRDRAAAGDDECMARAVLSDMVQSCLYAAHEVRVARHPCGPRLI